MKGLHSELDTTRSILIKHLVQVEAVVFVQMYSPPFVKWYNCSWTKSKVEEMSKECVGTSTSPEHAISPSTQLFTVSAMNKGKGALEVN